MCNILHECEIRRGICVSIGGQLSTVLFSIYMYLKNLSRIKLTLHVYITRNLHSWIIITGARAETGSRVKGSSGYDTEGVRGLKALGVRDLTYKMAYLACTVSSSNPRVR